MRQTNKQKEKKEKKKKKKKERKRKRTEEKQKEFYNEKTRGKPQIRVTFPEISHRSAG